MKFLLCLASCLVIPLSYAGGIQEWKPKYQIQKAVTKQRFLSSKKENQKDVVQEMKLQSAAPMKMPLKNKQTIVKKSKDVDGNVLEAMYRRKFTSKVSLESLKKKTLELKQDAVPTLIKVMKDGSFPEKNRWIATFMLGRIMGKKSAPFISKFANHPNWMMRLASLKTLLALDQKQYKGLYAKLLRDKAMIVRFQALENIRKMQLNDLAPYVWAMLYDKSNYQGSEGNMKRASIIREVIRSMGDLQFDEARKPMLSMIQKKKYSDIFEELDYSLNKLSKENSPEGSAQIKKHYWSRMALKNKTI